jgi:hypothetical protein
MQKEILTHYFDNTKTQFRKHQENSGIVTLIAPSIYMIKIGEKHHITT